MDKKKYDASSTRWRSGYRRSERRPYYEGERNFQRNSNPRDRSLTFLNNLTKEDPELVVMKLFNDRNGFTNILTSEISPNLMVVIVKLLKIVCECNFVESKLSLIHSILKTKFIDKLMIYINSLVIQDSNDILLNQYFWDNTEEFWKNLAQFCKSVSELTITIACEHLPKLVKTIQICIPNFETETSIKIPEEVKLEFDIINKVISTALEQSKNKAIALKPATKNFDIEPPNNFREINIYPSVQEVTSDYHPFLRENIIIGPFQSVEQYLDIQFRLLREDFVAPLREGICSYLQQDKSKRLQNVRVYHNVQFISHEIVSEHNCYKIKFEHSTKKKTINYEHSRRFIFGSLLCFTKDNFKTILFGKVIQRDVKLLENGEIVVGFEDDHNICFGSKYLMVECSVYFEPYLHVLTVLKIMPTVNFPMKKYIIDVDNSQTFPSYLTIEHTYIFDDVEIFPFNWPNHCLHNLNDSQNAAYKAALTREFSIIQGPPGTGKTFLGLLVAKTLLQSFKVWHKRGPILIICFTNHALDQFLEGLLSTSKNIIRVGGQSKNDALQEYNLRHRKFDRDAAVIQKHYEVKDCLSRIRTIDEHLQAIYKFDSVVDFVEFRDIPVYNNSFINMTMQDKSDWLFGGRNIFLRRRQQTTRRSYQVNDTIHNNQEILKNDEETDEQLRNENEITDDEVFGSIRVRGLLMMESIMDLKCHLDEILQQLNILKTTEVTQENHLSLISEEIKLQEKYPIYEDKYNYLQMRLQEGKTEFSRGTIFQLPEHIDLNAPYRSTADERWFIYFYFLQEYIADLKRKKQRLIIRFKRLYKEYNEMREIEDVQVMKTASVVGMTTTGAARLRSSLQSLKSQIVIVEEAAEVLESHIVTSITEDCQHLILIGDHQQLQPSTSDYCIKNKYKLGISLFERMVKNNIQCHTLNVQHRMRPEISSLITPTIYPDLQNHESVKHRSNITGVDKNVFFIDHTHPETACQDESKKNTHEAKFLINLCRYLILNGYEPEQITILVAYLGQLYEMQAEKKFHSNILQNVRIAVLDNYQGEESDVILLSLVRNNNEDSIGFLKNENRVCVALSRARNGLYIMGNMTLLCNNSDVWKKVKQSLHEQNAIGTHLKLRCQVHTTKITEVNSSDDFIKLSEGGCEQLCNATLDCGHACTSICHVQDRNHDFYKCGSICNKKLCGIDDNHICKKRCFEPCGPCNFKVEKKLSCGHIGFVSCHVDPKDFSCMVIVDTVLPCGHEAQKPCSSDPETFNCQEKCSSRVEPCGHACLRNCHIRNDPDHLEYDCKKPCAKYPEGCMNKDDEFHLCKKLCYEDCGKCEIKLKKHRKNCTHVDKVYCYVDNDQIFCEKPCNNLLECGHKCKNKCGDPCGPCKELYDCKKPCAKYPEGCMNKDDEFHLCKKLCYEDCGKCEIKLKKHRKNCTHVDKVYCYVDNDQIFCEKPCNNLLECGHKCKNKCGDPCGPCKELVEKIVPDCGHQIKIVCSVPATKENCHGRCPRKMACGHICTKKCNEVCTSVSDCIELVECSLESPCGHTIENIVCGLYNIGEIINKDERLLEYCNTPCNATLKCSHVCSGTCSSCKRGKFHVRCNTKCGAIQICGHSCKLPCREACKPCIEPCYYKCQHSVCTKRCGQPCTLCKEKCPRRCKHAHCRNWCGAICSIDPCWEPCDKKLIKCNHNCIGFCGDPCPPLCKICDAQELKTIFFGNEEDEDARFVLLLDCRHVMEANGMEDWLNQTDDEIKIKECPRCKVPIVNTPRYFDYVKQSFMEISLVKKLLVGDQADNNRDIHALFTAFELFERNLNETTKEAAPFTSRDQLRLISNRHTKSSSSSHIGKMLLEIVNLLKKRISPVNNKRRQHISKQEINNVSIKLKILKNIYNVVKVNKKLHSEDVLIKVIAAIVEPLTKMVDQISQQEIFDIDKEIDRLHRLMQLLEIEKSPNYLSCKLANDTEVVALDNHANEVINTIFVYDSEIDKKAKEVLEKLTNAVKNSSKIITDRERTDIVNAMKVEGASLGHWYKCKNGHPYYIGECGGAMQEATCDCGAKIGGQNHRLLNDNSVATEMDGAKHGAWSEAANMGNYMFP